MFLSTNSLSIVYTFFPENISLFPLISWFVLYLILQAFTNQNATDSNIEMITPNCFPHPNVNVGLVLKLDDQDLWKSDPPSISGVIKCIEARDAMLPKFCELWY